MHYDGKQGRATDNNKMPLHSLSKAATDQFKAGMCVAGVVEALCQYPHLLEGYFVANKATPLTAG